MMLCKKPIRTAQGYYVPCGQCMSCRVTRLNEIVTRSYLEYRGNGNEGTFFTLTYAPEHLPEGGTLVKKDFQKFMKRFRKYIQLKHIRYMGVGEYGSKTQRPHYHGIIYGLPHSYVERFIKKAWKLGFVMSRPLSGVGAMKDAMNSINYTASYTLKKMTHKDHEDLNGREPEFWLASRKPAFGYTGLHEIAEQLIKMRLYPSRSLEIKDKFVLDRLGYKVVFNLWDGNFFVSDDGTYTFPDIAAFDKLWPDPKVRRERFRHYFGRRLRLDTTMMNHLGNLVRYYADIDLPEASLVAKNSLEEKQYCAYLDRIKHKQMLDIIKREEANEHEQAEKAAYKIVRRNKASKEKISGV